MHKAVPEHVDARATRGSAVGPRPRRHKTITRARVLDAAEKLFGENGFHATSMQQIAAEAGYTTGALYSSFKGKDDLFLAILMRRREARERVWRDALGEALVSVDGAVAMGASLVPDPAWYSTLLEFMLHAARNPELRDVVSQMSGYGSRQAFFAETLRGVSASSPLDVDRLGPIILALVHGFSEMWFAEPESADPTLFADAVAVLTGARTVERTSPITAQKHDAPGKGLVSGEHASGHRNSPRQEEGR
jgi:AcrR family transcriptional regulator